MSYSCIRERALWGWKCDDFGDVDELAMKWMNEVGATIGELETHWDSWSDARREEFVSRGKIVSEAAGHIQKKSPAA